MPEIPFLDLQSPITWAAAVAVVVILYIRRKNILGAGDTEEKRDEDQTRVFVHDDQGYREKLGDTFSGNVAYGTGAFVRNVECSMRFFYGRPKRDPELLTSRKQTTVYMTRFGDASPLNPHLRDWKPEKVSRDTFNNYRSIAVEREYSRGRMESQKSDPQKKLLFAVSIGAMILGGIGWAIVLILPLTPLVEKAPPL